MADRITYGDDGVLDEIVVSNAKIHLERLSDTAINVNITDAQGKVWQFAIIGRKLHVTPFLGD